MLACCISACVTVNRFGFALDGALCSLDRIYHDFKNGELKDSNPKWIGFKDLETISTNLLSIENNITKLKLKNCTIEKEDYCNGTKVYNKLYKKLYGSLDILQILYKDNNKKPINELKEYFHNNQTEFDNLKKTSLKNVMIMEKFFSVGWRF